MPWLENGPIGQIEEFAFSLADHFLSRNEHLSCVSINIRERIWECIQAEGRVQPHAFRIAGPEQREVNLDHTRENTAIYSAIRDLAITKTARSSFENFLRDEFTTLKDTQDRLLSTSLCAQWRCLPVPRTMVNCGWPSEIPC